MPPRKRATASTSSRRTRNSTAVASLSVGTADEPSTGSGRSPSASVVSDHSEASRGSAPSRTSTRKSRTPRASRATSRSTANSAGVDEAKTSRSTRSTRDRSRTDAKRSPSPQSDPNPSSTPTPPALREPRSSTDKGTSSLQVERVLPLPAERNPVLPSSPLPVKLQVIQREILGNHDELEMREIIVGRVKLPTVNGPTHGFLLKRFDTNAVAASSMFRIAFPYATPEDESAEMGRLLRTYQCDVANGGRIEATDPKGGIRYVLPGGSTGVMLQGVWLPASDVQAVSEEYGLTTFTKPLVESRADLIDGRPYFLDSDGRPFAASNGVKLDSKERNFLWTNLETEREARELKARVANEDITLEDKVSQEEIVEPLGKRSRPQYCDRDGGDEEHNTVTDPEAAIQAAREEARAIQAAASHSAPKSSLGTKAKFKRRAQVEPEDGSVQQETKEQPRGSLTRAQKETQRLKEQAAARATAKSAPGISAPISSGTETEVAVARRRIAGSARVRALMRQHPVASAAGVAGISFAATAAATAAAAATGLIPPEQWATAISAVQEGVASLQHWFA